MKKHLIISFILLTFISACSDESSEQVGQSEKTNVVDQQVAPESTDVSSTVTGSKDAVNTAQKQSAVEDTVPADLSQTDADTDTNKALLKVCADPYMMPYSNQQEEGYENKIANLIAEKFGMEVKYTFFPQRIGFIRNTLRAEEGDGFKCDLVITVPDKFELAATTDPYYTTSYVLVYVKGRKLDDVTSPEMLSDVVNKEGRDIKIGLSDRGPGQMWVFYNELMSNMVPYQGQPGDPKVIPGQKLIEELIAGNIDATVIMGPTAGYFAKKYKDKAELVLLTLQDDPRSAELKFKYNFSMAVRYGEKEWKEKLNNFIKDNKAEIEDILLSYGVPLIK